MKNRSTGLRSRMVRQAARWTPAEIASGPSRVPCRKPDRLPWTHAFRGAQSQLDASLTFPCRESIVGQGLKDSDWGGLALGLVMGELPCWPEIRAPGKNLFTTSSLICKGGRQLSHSTCWEGCLVAFLFTSAQTAIPLSRFYSLRPRVVKPLGWATTSRNSGCVRNTTLRV